jgi:hypothetical protein
MRRTLLFLALAACIPAAGAAAQDHPDFSGTWKINLIKSDAAPAGRGGQQMDMSNLVHTITQTAEAITIVQTGMGPERTTTYYLDGRESTNPAMRGEMKSTSTWDGKQLVTAGSTTMQTPNGERTITIKEVRSLSDDGKTMTITTTTDSQMGSRTQKRVFDKQ